jgi:NRPS condensation-like uncharacterized protein
MRLFPLPLTAFEHYMLADDRPGYPMTFFFRLTFAGHLAPRRFHDALRAALERHPLLRAHVRGRVDGMTWRLSWVDASPRGPWVSWDEKDVPVHFPGSPRIDLRGETGLRVWVRAGPDVTSVLLQFHHACCDGIGAVHFLETFLAAYAAPSSLNGAAVGPFLRSRGRHAVAWRERVGRLPKDAARIARFFRTAPQPLAPCANARGDEPVLDAFAWLLSHTLDEAAVACLRAEGKRRGVTLNDLLLRDLFVALDGWNRQHSPGARTLRIAVPTSMRPPERQSTSAVNDVSMVFVDRNSRQVADPERLLDSIHAETEDVKRWKMGFTLLGVVRLAGCLPGGFRALLGGERCLNSAVLSNLGVVTDRLSAPGRPVLREVEFFPPIRAMTRAAFGIVSHRGRLTVGLHFDQRALTAVEGQKLLGAFVAQVKRSTE